MGGPFDEDFLDQIVGVHWKGTPPVYTFYASATIEITLGIPLTDGGNDNGATGLSLQVFLQAGSYKSPSVPLPEHIESGVVDGDPFSGAFYPPITTTFTSPFLANQNQFTIAVSDSAAIPTKTASGSVVVRAVPSKITPQFPVVTFSVDAGSDTNTGWPNFSGGAAEATGASLLVNFPSVSPEGKIIGQPTAKITVGGPGS